MWEDIVNKATQLLRRRDDSEMELLNSVEFAREQWLSSKVYFDTVTDPDLIDHAIYQMVAAERRYVYLLRAAQKRGVKVPLLPQ